MQHKIVGTCQELFKDYLRLTSVGFGCPPCRRSSLTPSQEPDPKKIRPYSVLRETVDKLKSRWKQKENYNWICSQFKSVRQDLTVSLPSLPLTAAPDFCHPGTRHQERVHSQCL